MRILPLLLLTASVSTAFSAIRAFGYEWAVPDASDWQIASHDGLETLHLLIGKEPPSTGPRRPFQFALAQTTPLARVHLTLEARALQRSLIIVYAYRDASHFDYAHLSSDTALQEPHHNGIFHVYGGERVRISDVSGPAALPDNHAWCRVQLDWDGANGTVDVAVNGRPVPALHAADTSLKQGRIGLGSFDETAEFRKFTLKN